MTTVAAAAATPPVTLSGIAARYRVSVASLRSANRLPASGMIRAGQKLTLRGGVRPRSR